MNERTPGYFAVIPASVRYDDEIPANAKLLYGEISALIGAEGYCYAKNGYFADLYKLSERTITGLLSKLQQGGHIKIQLERDKNGQVTNRKLFLSESATDGQPLENIFYTPRKYFREGIENNFQYTDTSNTDIDKENKKESSDEKKQERGRAPKTDFDALPLFVDWIAAVFDEETAERKNQLYFALVRFVENRVALKKPIKTKGAVTALCNRLLRYSQCSQDRLAVMVDLLDLSTANNWQSIYPPKDTQTAAPARTGRGYECLDSEEDAEWVT